MSQLEVATNANDEISMNTYEVWKKYNEFRVEAGEPELRHNDFIARVEDELKGEISLRHFRTERGKSLKCYDLDRDQILLVGMRESKVVRRQVLSWLNKMETALKEIKHQSSILEKIGKEYLEVKDNIKNCQSLGGQLTQAKRKLHKSKIILDETVEVALANNPLDKILTWK